MRGADLLRVALEPSIDVNEQSQMGYVDVDAHVTKMNRVRLQTSRMSVSSTAHSLGLYADHWAQTWLQARTNLGLDASEQGFLLPSEHLSILVTL